jgi:hypothetical protein
MNSKIRLYEFPSALADGKDLADKINFHKLPSALADGKHIQVDVGFSQK